MQKNFAKINISSELFLRIRNTIVRKRNETFRKNFMQPKEYDGFYFTPAEHDNELNITFFDFKSEVEKGDPICNTSIGDCWHIAFFRQTENGLPYFDEAFDAILSDPTVYVKNLLGANLYGCIVRKTEKSQKWFDDYLHNAKEHVKMLNLAEIAKNIAENK